MPFATELFGAFKLLWVGVASFPGNGFKGSAHTLFAPFFRLCGRFPGFYIGSDSCRGHFHPTLFVFKIDSFSVQQEYLDELVVMLALEAGSAHPDHPQRSLDLEIRFPANIKKTLHSRVERAAYQFQCGMGSLITFTMMKLGNGNIGIPPKGNHTAVMETNFKAGLGSGVDPIFNVDLRVFYQHTRQTVVEGSGLQLDTRDCTGNLGGRNRTDKHQQEQ